MKGAAPTCAIFHAVSQPRGPGSRPALTTLPSRRVSGQSCRRKPSCCGRDQECRDRPLPGHAIVPLTTPHLHVTGLSSQHSGLLEV